MLICNGLHYDAGCQSMAPNICLDSSRRQTDFFKSQFNMYCLGRYVAVGGYDTDELGLTDNGAGHKSGCSYAMKPDFGLGWKQLLHRLNLKLLAY